MNGLKYLKDRTGLIVFYLINIGVINLVLLLDEYQHVNSSNVIYLDVLSLFLLAIYLVYDYRKYNMIYKQLKLKLEQQHFEPFDLESMDAHLQKAFFQLFNDFHKMMDESKEILEASNEEYYDFITSWVHAVKIPIAASRLLIESDGGSYNPKTLVNVENEIDKIERYIEQSLYYSRSVSFAKDYLSGEYNLNQLVSGAIKRFAKTFIAKKITLDVSIDEEIAIHTDRKWFGFILEQVISNALKYSDKQQGEIQISSYEDHKEYRLIIKDNGVGIKPEDISRVFERGFTGYNGRSFDQSTGMGLYLARKLANKLGHKIEMKSEVQAYTEVIIYVSKVGEYFMV